MEILYNGLFGLVEGGGGTGLALQGEETAVLQNITALMSLAQTHKEMDSHLEAVINLCINQSRVADQSELTSLGPPNACFLGHRSLHASVHLFPW